MDREIMIKRSVVEENQECFDDRGPFVMVDDWSGEVTLERVTPRMIITKENVYRLETLGYLKIEGDVFRFSFDNGDWTFVLYESDEQRLCYALRMPD